MLPSSPPFPANGALHQTKAHLTGQLRITQDQQQRFSEQLFWFLLTVLISSQTRGWQGVAATSWLDPYGARMARISATSSEGESGTVRPRSLDGSLRRQGSRTPR
jgi:hypothetical protein